MIDILAWLAVVAGILHSRVFCAHSFHCYYFYTILKGFSRNKEGFTSENVSDGGCIGDPSIIALRKKGDQDHFQVCGLSLREALCIQ